MSRFTTWLLMLLGATGLVLAAVGVYGVIAYVVAQRTHELGVRMALGASGGGVQWMVVRQGLVLAVAGVVLGVLASLAAARCSSRWSSASRRTIRRRSSLSPACWRWLRSWLATYRPAGRRASIRSRRCEEAERRPVAGQPFHELVWWSIFVS